MYTEIFIGVGVGESILFIHVEVQLENIRVAVK